MDDMLGIQPERVADAVADAAGGTVSKSNECATDKKYVTALIPCQIDTTAARQVKAPDVRLRGLHVNYNGVTVERREREVFVVRGKRQGSRLNSDRDRPDLYSAISQILLPVVFRSREREHRDVS
jgi:hypothetical protein